MKSRKITITLAGIALTGLGGCATVPKDAGFGDVRKLAANRTGHLVQWRGKTAADAKVDAAVHALLQKPLTVDEAVQIALLNNANLQATYEDLGIAQADLVQAGLLRNPTLSVERRFPGQAADIDVVQDFLDVLVLPLRRKIAAAQFEEAKLRVAHQIVDLTAEVKTAFYTLQAREQLLDRLRAITDLNQAAAKLAQRQYEAGTLNELGSVNQQAIYEESKIQVTQAETRLIADRERFNRLLGLAGVQTKWAIADHLPELPTSEIALDDAESRAVSQRLDLAALRQEIEAAARSLGFTKTFRYIPVLTLGVRYEHEIEPEHSIGPAVEVGVPLFDQGQARVARQKALLAQAQQKYLALGVEIRSQVREARDRMIADRKLVGYYKTLLPERMRIVSLTLLQYNGMLKGTYDLLMAKKNEVAAERQYIESWRDYWIEHSELERAIGGHLPTRPAATRPTTIPVAPPAPHHPSTHPASTNQSMPNMEGMPNMKGM